MSDQTAQHCPYLGLKQNQAIRFTDPTPEHRCYAAGGAQDIPQSQLEFQARYCLTAEHRRCPLYTGLVYTTTLSGRIEAESPQQRGVRSWLAGMSRSERRTYYGLVFGLGVLLLIYAVLAALWLLDGRRDDAPSQGNALLPVATLLLAVRALPAELPAAAAGSAQLTDREQKKRKRRAGQPIDFQGVRHPRYLPDRSER